jgi:hypothetical protein
MRYTKKFVQYGRNSKWPTTLHKKIVVIRYVTKCSAVEVHRRFVGTYHLHLQYCRVTQASSQQEVCTAERTLNPITLYRHVNISYGISPESD